VSCVVLLCRPSTWLSTVVQYVGYSASLKYLLVVLKPGFGGKQLAALQPDVAAMTEAVPGSDMTGVIVAAAAAAGAWQHQLASATDCYTSGRGRFSCRVCHW
jgi:hypothetical protein